MVRVQLTIAIGAIVTLASCGPQARQSVALPRAQAAVSPSPSTSNDDATSSPDEPTDVTESSGDPEPDVVEPPATANATGSYDCGSKRPTICEATVSPVCARQLSNAPEGTASENGLTYVNGCLACADPAIAGYVRGRCKQP